MNVIAKTRRRLTKLRLKEIPIFLFHTVSESYNPLLWWECDWTQLDLFKQNIMKLEKLYEFISLPEAHRHLKEDTIRFKKYAVLTADDGYRTLLGILPWLEKKKIPISLFINSCYLDTESWSDINEEQAKRTNPGVDMQQDVVFLNLCKRPSKPIIGIKHRRSIHRDTAFQLCNACHSIKDIYDGILLADAVITCYHIMLMISGST